MVDSLIWVFSHSFLTTMKTRCSFIDRDTEDVSILISEKHVQINIWDKFNNKNIVRFKKKSSIRYQIKCLSNSQLISGIRPPFSISWAQHHRPPMIHTWYLKSVLHQNEWKLPSKQRQCLSTRAKVWLAALFFLIPFIPNVGSVPYGLLKLLCNKPFCFCVALSSVCVQHSLFFIIFSLEMRMLRNTCQSNDLHF